MGKRVVVDPRPYNEGRPAFTLPEDFEILALCNGRERESREASAESQTRATVRAESHDPTRGRETGEKTRRSPRFPELPRSGFVQ